MTTQTPDPVTATKMTPTEVASLFGVNPKTVTRWANAGRLVAHHTLGGHRRFVRDEVMALYESTRTTPEETP